MSAIDAERVAEHITKTVAEWPPLTNEQRDRLALLLRPAEDRSGAASQRSTS